MTQKEEFLLIRSYEEFDQKRERFKGLRVDKEIKEHMRKIFPKVDLFKGDAIYRKKSGDEGRSDG